MLPKIWQVSACSPALRKKTVPSKYQRGNKIAVKFPENGNTEIFQNIKIKKIRYILVFSVSYYYFSSNQNNYYSYGVMRSHIIRHFAQLYWMLRSIYPFLNKKKGLQKVGFFSNENNDFFIFIQKLSFQGH